MPLNPFYTYIIGADRPVGQLLARALAAENYLYRGFGMESRERIAMQGNGQPYFVLAPSVFSDVDLHEAEYWIESLLEQDAPIIFVSSLAVFGAQPGIRHGEESERFADSVLARRLLQLEERVRASHRHLILRVGMSFSVQAGDFAHALLTTIRDRRELVVDDVELFSPTPDDDIATVLLALLKQVDCAGSLWGTYHFCGVEPITSYGFAEALLAEAGQYEDLSDVLLLAEEGAFKPAIRVPCGNNTGIFYGFGIQKKAWREGLGRLVRRYYRVGNS